jgi:hypothetical protein
VALGRVDQPEIQPGEGCRKGREYFPARGLESWVWSFPGFGHSDSRIAPGEEVGEDNDLPFMEKDGVCAAQTGPGPSASALGQGHRAALPCVRVPWVRARSRSLGFCAPARPSCRAPSARRGRGWWRVVVVTWLAAYRPLACQKACGVAQPLVSAGARQGERRRRLCRGGRSSRREQRGSILWRGSLPGAMGT